MFSGMKTAVALALSVGLAATVAAPSDGRAAPGARRAPDWVCTPVRAVEISDAGDKLSVTDGTEGIPSFLLWVEKDAVLAVDSVSMAAARSDGEAKPSRWVLMRNDEQALRAVEDAIA